MGEAVSVGMALTGGGGSDLGTVAPCGVLWMHFSIGKELCRSHVMSCESCSCVEVVVQKTCPFNSFSCFGGGSLEL